MTESELAYIPTSTTDSISGDDRVVMQTWIIWRVVAKISDGIYELMNTARENSFDAIVGVRINPMPFVSNPYQQLGGIDTSFLYLVYGTCVRYQNSIA
jgi:hypothetical protein